jgi:hypothetical protein
MSFVRGEAGWVAYTRCLFQFAGAGLGKVGLDGWVWCGVKEGNDNVDAD